MTPGPTLVAVLACVLLCLPVQALAAKDDDASVVAAREHVAKAKVHFKIGEFDEAIAEWKEAYRLKNVPSILFNIAQAYRLVGNYKQSRFQYQNYLQDMPNAPNRDEVERQLQQLELLIADEAKKGTPVVEPTKPVIEPPKQAVVEPPKPVKPSAEVVPPVVAPPKVEAPKGPASEPPPKAAAVEPTPPAPPEPVVETPPTTSIPAVVAAGDLELPQEEQGSRLLPLSLAGGGAALLVLGGVFYGLARSGWSEATAQERTRAQVDELIESADGRYQLAQGLGVVGVLLGVGAAVTFAF